MIDMPPFPIASFFGLDVAEMIFLIPIVALCIPIVSIITKHRYRVVEMKMRMRGYNEQAVGNQQKQIEELKGEVKELKELVHQQMISVDSLITNQTRLLEGAKRQDIQSRISN